ncbi:MAG: 50S ribosomal protein L29 [Coriobacteriia bacterium]|nr:50S ribosomal protein L29 [Coriobacteriia bacterium]
MKASEIHELTNDDLKTALADSRAELFNLRFQMATSQLDNTARIKMVKKDIARILTEIRERELSEAAQLFEIEAQAASTADTALSID